MYNQIRICYLYLNWTALSDLKKHYLITDRQIKQIDQTNMPVTTNNQRQIDESYTNIDLHVSFINRFNIIRQPIEYSTTLDGKHVREITLSSWKITLYYNSISNKQVCRYFKKNKQQNTLGANITLYNDAFANKSHTQYQL